MSESQYTGNNVVSGDFLRVLLALKTNVMRDLNVSDICQIKQHLNDGSYLCQSLSDESSFTAIPLMNVRVEVNDVVVVLFSNYDFRSNLKRLQLNQPTQPTTSNVHSKSNGIIIGIIYTERTN